MRVMPDDRRRLLQALADGTLPPATARAVSHAMPQNWRRTAAAQELEVADLIERMNNWQRQQYARAGYPREPASIRRYAAMQKGQI